MNEAVHSHAVRRLHIDIVRRSKRQIDPVISNTSDWYVDEMWEYSSSHLTHARKNIVLLSVGMFLSQHCEETSDGAETARRPERRAAPLRKAIFFGDTDLVIDQPVEAVEKEMKERVFSSSTPVSKRLAGMEEAVTVSAVFINSTILGQVIETQNPQVDAIERYLGENVFGIALEPRASCWEMAASSFRSTPILMT